LPAVADKDISASKDLVFIVGYGRVGQLVCEMLDRKCIPYVVLEGSPERAIEARNRGLPVYFGELFR
jgi:voltage-gated potassium channel Kch